MEGLVNKAALLGWISSLETKDRLLNQFAKITSRGGQESLSALNGFIDLLENHRGKTLNNSAYYLLKVNAQYLKNRLQGKAIPVWPNLKKKKAKDPVADAQPCIDEMVEFASRINNSLYLEYKAKGLPSTKEVMCSGCRCPIGKQLYRINSYQSRINNTFNFTIYCTAKHPGFEENYPQVSSHNTTLYVLKSPADLKNVPNR